jgi:hypothetical protein
MKNSLLLGLLLFVFLLGRAQAQVPPILNYQGRITVGTTNFSGSGQFRFALTNSTGSTYYWSSDGSVISPPNQPTNAVTLTVTNGLYSVLLGDTTLTNMTAIPASAFTNADVRLRVWFNDGSHGSQLLSPDQRLAASGYALMAGGVDLPVTTSAAIGTLELGGAPFLHAYGANGLSSENTFAGGNAGNFTLSGSLNTGAGYEALFADTSGSGNTATGATALMSNTAGNGNTAAGFQALLGNTIGSNNSAVGNSALSSNTAAGENVAFGTGALQLQSFANSGTAWNSLNVAIGYEALYSNQPTATTNGLANVALGGNALYGNTTGSNNIGVGNNAGYNLTTGSNNIDIGSQGVAGETGIIRLGDGATQTDTYLTGIIHGSGSGLTGITSSGLAAGSVTSTQIATGAVGTAQLASGAVGTAQLASGAVGTTQLASALTLSGTTTFSGLLNLQGASSATAGVINLGGTRLLHAYGAGGTTDGNTFVGSGAGNFTMSGTRNTGSGYQTLFRDTSGSFNTASGWEALSANTTGANNTGTGSGALQSNTSGGNNSALGYYALNTNFSANDNSAVGYEALYSNGFAGENVALGSGALYTQSFSNSGTAWNSLNVAVGYQALYNNQPTSTANGINNTATGAIALTGNTTGTDNTANGYGALSANTTAGENVALGSGALQLQSFSNSNTTYNSQNVAVGYQALHSNQPTSTLAGIQNTAVGATALVANTTGNFNTSVGNQSLSSNNTGSSNTALGLGALDRNTSGGNNIAVGNSAGDLLTTGSNDIDIGNEGVAGESNVIRLGTSQTSTFLTGSLNAGTATANVNLLGRTGVGLAAYSNVGLTAQRFGSTEYCAYFQTETGALIAYFGQGSDSLYVNTSSGGAYRSDNSSSWSTSSDARIKHEVFPVTGALATLARIRPVRFHYNADFLAKRPGAADTEHYGVVAQEFQQVFPDYVDTDKDGMLSVRMDPIPIVTAAAVQELDAKLQDRDAALTRLQEENATLQKRLTDLEAKAKEAEALKNQFADLEAKDKERDNKLAAIEELLRAKAQPAVRNTSLQTGN